MWMLLAALAVADTCDDAANRYEGCIEEIIGGELAAGVRAKRTEGVAACRQDDKTQRLYVKCLPTKDCAAFLECLTKTALEMSGPLRPAGDRKKQCQEHVADGLDGIRQQLEMLKADNIDARVEDHGEQRQRDCQSWPDDLAACVLRLEGAKDCDPDEFPFWRASIPTGAAGPKSTWTAKIQEWDYDEPGFEWGPDGILVVSDKTGIRGLRAGKELWKIPGEHKQLRVAGPALATWGTGIQLWDVATGKKRADMLSEVTIDGLGPGADGKLIAITDEGALYRIDPACKGKKCATADGKIGSDYLVYSPHIFEVGGVLVVGDDEWFQAYDSKREPTFDMILRRYGADEVAPAPPGHIAVVDSGGIALLEPGSCEANGRELYLRATTGIEVKPVPADVDCPKCVVATKGCIAVSRSSGMGTWQIPIPAGKNAIAFNDHGIIENTHLLGISGGWEVKTGGQGDVAVDGKHVYTVSTGQDGDKVELLALKISDGTAVWHATLPGAVAEQDEYANYRVVVGSGGLAVRVGDTLFGLPLPADGADVR